jgi:2-(1,2-epoxy-1,2-dihydrophenyl)acetyl-CoA isomerase
MTEAPVRVDRDDALCTIWLNRPDRSNGLDRQLGESLLNAFLRASSDDSVRCIAITASGRAFCAGDDLDTVAAYLSGDRRNAAAFPISGDAYYARLCEAILCARKPVVVGLNGAAVGAGAEIACAADYRIASRSARIGSGLVQVGHPGNAVMLTRVLGPARATALFLTGELVAAEEALRIGLVDRVVDDDRLSEELATFCAGLAAGPTKAIAMFKDLRERALWQPSVLGLRLQDAVHVRTEKELEDGYEGPKAFLERRPAAFTGR